MNRRRPRRPSFGSIESLEQRALLAATVLDVDADNHLTNFQNQQANLGGTDRLQFYKVGSDVYRPLLQFDTAGITAGTTIGSAQLQLWHEVGLYANADMDVTVYALTRDWAEGSDYSHGSPGSGSSWLNAADGTAWATPGGDFVTNRDFGNGPNGIVARETISSFTTEQWVSFDLTSVVEAWVNGGLPNYGVGLVITSGEDTEHQFSSGESSSLAQRPRLVVDSEAVPVPGRLGLTQNALTVDEDGGQVQLVVERTQGSDGVVTVAYATSNGSATSPSDYTLQAGTLVFANGETSKTINIPIVDDVVSEAAESFSISLSNPTGGATLANNATTITISPNDGATTEVVLHDARDNHLTNFQNQRANLGGTDRIQFFKSGTALYRPLIQFDVSSLDSSTAVVDATVELFRDGGFYANNPMDVTIYALDKPWDEGNSFNHGAASSGSDWLYRNDASPWDTPGGDFNTSHDFGSGQNGIVSQTTIAPYSEDGWVQFDVSGAVRAWLDGSVPNHGLAFVLTSGEDTEYQFYSSEASPATRRPRLTVETSDAPPSAGILSLSSSNVTVNEDAGTAILDVTRSSGTAGVVSVQYATQNGSAIAGSDYAPVSGTLVFLDGETTKSITVPIVNDVASETLESFSLALTNPTGGASIGTGSALLTIIDDDQLSNPGTLSIAPVTAAVDEDAGTVTLTISRTAGSDGTVSVQYATENVFAEAGSDYVASSGTLSFADGETSKTVSVSILDDTADEADETFRVVLSAVSGGASLGATTSTVTVVDNDEPLQPGRLALASSIYTVDEDAGVVDVTIVRTNGSDGTVTIEYQTFSGTATGSANGDFASRSGTATFVDGQTEFVVAIPINNDNLLEADESFSITIDNPAGGAALLAPRTATVTILDDEAGITELVRFDDFTDVSELNLNGAAANNGNRLDLTPATNNSAGSSFLTQPLEVTDSTSFETQFAFSMAGGSSGADGLTFVLHDDVNGSRSLGAAGGSVGYEGISQSLAIEFDTWQNPGDRSNNHIEILRDGNRGNSLGVNTSPFDLNSGSTYYAWVNYDGTTELLDVYLNNQASQPASPVLSVAIDLAEVVGSQAFVGFTAGTGGANNVHAIHDWVFSSNSRLLPAPPVVGSVVAEQLHSGLVQPTSIDWSPDGRNLYISEQRGVIRVARDGNLIATPFVDFTAQVNGTRDRGLLDIAVHPDFQNTPYVYLLYTYDPPEVFANASHNLAGPDRNGNRAGRLTRVTADASTNYTTIVPGSEVTILGTNSTWSNFNAFVNSTSNFNEPPAGINSDGTNIRDFIATDSESHTVGAVEFGPDGALYVSIGDGTSYNRVDPRTVRVQDVDNLSGKVLRINPIDGKGYADNPFFNGDADANRSKVYFQGVRNAFRMTIDQSSGQVYVGDVGWTAWEEINTGPSGANFGWPYYEGGDGVSLRTGGYQDLPEAQAFYNSGTPVVAPLVGLNHAQTGINAIVLGDIYTGDVYPSQFQDAVFFNDLGQGIVRAASLDAQGTVTGILDFTTGAQVFVQMKQGPDGTMHYVDLLNGRIGRWVFDSNSATSQAVPVEGDGANLQQPAIAGSGVTVAVIDSGVQTDHPELQSALWYNANEIPGDQIDNDGNGYVDDIVGFDFLEYDADPYDTNGHGTFVAGVIAAAHDQTGTSGIAPYARIMPLRVLNESGAGDVDRIAEAIRYAVDNGADIVSLALAGSNNDELLNALEYASDHGVLIVAPAGNTAGNGPLLPAAMSAVFDNIVSAGALGLDGLLLDDSNAVGPSGAVQLDAFGVLSSTTIESSFATYRGTSVATAVISGAAALIKATNHELTGSQIRDVLLATADPAMEGSDATGTLNVANAVELAGESAAVRITTSGNRVIVKGTLADDSIAYSMLRPELVQINGVDYDVPVGFDRIVLNGLAGEDVVTVIGTPGDDSAVLKRLSAKLESTFEVVVAKAEHIVIDGRSGTDVATLLGTARREEFVGGPSEALLRGADFINEVRGFAKVQAESRGGDDEALLSDSASDDFLIIKPEYARMDFSAGHIRVDDFTTVRAIAETGFDRARVYDSPYADRAYLSPTMLRLNRTTNTYVAAASGFDHSIVYGSSGTDYAWLYDSSEDDVLKSRPFRTEMRSPGVKNIVLGFDRSIGFASEGIDKAILDDSRDTDTFTARPNRSLLDGGGHRVRVDGFEEVIARSRHGFDKAYLYDSDGNDVFTTTPTRATMQGSGFAISAVKFDLAKGISRNGQDIARLHDSVGDDRLEARSNKVTLRDGARDTYKTVAEGFGVIAAYASDGVDELKLFGSLDYIFERFGDWELL